MSVKVYCPECDAPIKAPDSAAGTRIDCPECDARVRVPDPDDRPRRRRGADRDDEDDRPRKSEKKGGKKKRMSRGLVIGLIAGGAALLLVVLVVGGIVAYQLMRPPADKTMAGTDWYKADDPDRVFTAYFPGGKPKYEEFGFQPPAILARKAGVKGDFGFSGKTWVRKEGGRTYSVLLMKFPSGGSTDAAEQAAAHYRTPPVQGVAVLADEAATVGGHQARRTVVRSGDKAQASVFVGIGGGQFLTAVVAGDTSVSLADPLVAAFFENLAIKP